LIVIAKNRSRSKAAAMLEDLLDGQANQRILIEASRS